jgi:hypothetical protein
MLGIKRRYLPLYSHATLQSNRGRDIVPLRVMIATSKVRSYCSMSCMPTVDSVAAAKDFEPATYRSLPWSQAHVKETTILTDASTVLRFYGSVG